jgi:hypothetical protein
MRPRKQKSGAGLSLKAPVGALRTAFARSCALSAFLMAPSAMADGAAMILMTDGDTVPVVEPLQELSVGDSLSLSPGAVVAIVHYAACEEIELRGGRIRVATSAIAYAGSSVEYRAKGDCPEEIKLVDTDAQGAVTLTRSGPSSDAIAGSTGPRPRFVIAGPRIPETVIHVFQEDAEIMILPVEAGRAGFPDDAPDLTAGASYRFAIGAKDGSHRGGSFHVVKDGPALIVLRP